MVELLTNWQKVILLNYGIVPTFKIAKIIKTSEQTVIENAKLLGFDDQLNTTNSSDIWIKNGFVTIIRCNWDLLSNENIAYLLDMTMSDFEKTLKEYDFLDVKLGDKPIIPDITYSPLNSIQHISTFEVKEIVTKNSYPNSTKPFDFYSNWVSPYFVKNNSCTIKNRFISNYSASYSGALLDNDLSDYSEDYLQKLSKTGSNGIWLSDTLRNLAPFPFDMSYSKDYKTRIKNLEKLTKRCAKYGIDVYLYMNEPRSIAEGFFNKYPELKGQMADDGTYCLCTSNKKVQKYLYDAFYFIAKSCPLLKGIMIISMSENPTHCYSRYWHNNTTIQTDCPICSKRLPQDIVAEVNNIICKALQDGNGKTKLISNIWGWKNYANCYDKEVFETIDKLDKRIEVLCVSEYSKEFTREGVKSNVDDYSISVVGPSDFATKVLTYAKDKGHKIWAKVQINNSWECSAVPFIPAFDLMVEHIKSLQKLSIDGLMLGWSLGGYLGGALPLINTLCENNNFDIESWYEKTFGENLILTKNAVSTFSKAFTLYPFSVASIYFGGHNLGPANIWSLKQQNRQSSMVCFTFDDTATYTSIYGEEKYIHALKNLCDGWENGLNLIANINGNNAFTELKQCALACFIHFKSALNLTQFSIYKKDISKNKSLLLNLIQSETEITKKLINLISQNNKIGFEMTNHYYYNRNILLYKLVNLKSISGYINSVL